LREERERLLEVEEVVVRARLQHNVGEVADRRHRVVGEWPELGEERTQADGDRLGRVHERIEVVEGGAQVDERRVRLPHEVRQERDRLLQRDALVAERAEGRVRVAYERRERVTTLGQGGDERRAVDEEARQERGVAIELAEQAAGGREGGVEEVIRGALLSCLALELGGGVLEEGLE